MFKTYDTDLDSSKYIDAQISTIKENNLKHMNCCIEWLGYKLLNLKQLIQSGVLKDIPDIHREAIDKQSANPIHKK